MQMSQKSADADKYDFVKEGTNRRRRKKVEGT